MFCSHLCLVPLTQSQSSRRLSAFRLQWNISITYKVRGQNQMAVLPLWRWPPQPINAKRWEPGGRLCVWMIHSTPRVPTVLRREPGVFFCVLWIRPPSSQRWELSGGDFSLYGFSLHISRVSCVSVTDGAPHRCMRSLWREPTFYQKDTLHTRQPHTRAVESGCCRPFSGRDNAPAKRTMLRSISGARTIL
jgi:hypothetical protein